MSNANQQVSELYRHLQKLFEDSREMPRVDISGLYISLLRAGNHMGYLIQQMKQHPEATELSMACCTGDVKEALRYLYNLDQLQSLDLTGTELSSVNVGSFIAIKNLEQLNVSNAHIDEGMLRVLAREHPSLKQLNLTGIRLSDRSIMTLAQCQIDKGLEIVANEGVMQQLEAAHKDIRLGNTRKGANRFDAMPEGDGSELVHTVDTSEQAHLSAGDAVVAQQDPDVQVTAAKGMGPHEFIVGATDSEKLRSRMMPRK